VSDAVVVDASAALAIYLGEAEAEIFKSVLASERCVMGGPSLLEVHMRVARATENPALADDYSEFLKTHLDIVDLTPAMAAYACAAFNAYGKGLGHKAGLNFGDCLTYAVAIGLDAPLLFKGRDFGHTDLKLHQASAPL